MRSIFMKLNLVSRGSGLEEGLEEGLEAVRHRHAIKHLVTVRRDTGRTDDTGVIELRASVPVHVLISALDIHRRAFADVVVKHQ